MAIEPTRKVLRKIFGSRNDRLIKTYSARAAEVDALQGQMGQKTDGELRAMTQAFRDRTNAGESEKQIRHEALAVAREVMDRAVGIRSIFNPERGFDPTVLPEDAQALYAQVKAEIDAREPEPVLGGEPAPNWMQVEIPVRLYEAVRELHPKSRPPFRARPFTCQIIGGMVLGEGAIAEMKTGEGKTIVAPLACYVACCENLQCHVVTVNDYLVQRDRDWVFPFYYWLGLTVGAIHPHHMQNPQEKATHYDADVVYGTNAEFGFDYLRDNMKLSVQQQLQKRRDFCIIDEVDSILIDEARTPLIISGPARVDAPRYAEADRAARHLLEKQKEWDAANTEVERVLLKIKGLEGDVRNSRDKAQAAEMRGQIKELEASVEALEAQRDTNVQYYELEPERKAAHLTHEGVAEAQKFLAIGSFYVGENMDMPHLMENALRAHAIYHRDKEYVVDNGEVVIVDENTGRKMPGRQWSDGLHQAVESKEGLKIKEETQTLATITIQNFAKLYQRLAGMTGTAVTEATEFKEIYSREVVVIPTNVPIARDDRNDRIYLHEKDKWNAIADEIKRVHDVGRCILVGTTSVGKSEMLSELLRKRHGIHHEVLNAKQHEREGEIVKDAGYLGSVMIATNMAGRGTDIVLQPYTREQLVEHWQKRGLLPRDADATQDDATLIELATREMARRELGLKPKEAQSMPYDELRLALYRHWIVQYAYVQEKKAEDYGIDDAMALLDEVEDFMLHRLELWPDTRAMGGLYVIGTERHESRRIDNQLRGRSGRQGDPGTTRFFLSLEDQLMVNFMPASMKSILARLGMKEGEALEHKMVSNSIQKAQRKVEEINYQRRKTLLEYDEVMEFQRGDFYGTRQRVLEGDHVDELIYDHIRVSVDDAVERYLAEDYVPQQVAEWCQSVLGVSIDPVKVILDDVDELNRVVQESARAEAEATVEMTLGEYMSNDLLPEEWDLAGLQAWARTLGITVDREWLASSSVDEVQAHLSKEAVDRVGEQDLSGLSRFLVEHYGAKELSEWARNKFGIELVPAELDELEREDATAQIYEQAQAAYQRREVTYPAEFVLTRVAQMMQQDPQGAMQQLVGFVESRYGEAWGPEQLSGKTQQDIHGMLVERSEEWLRNGRLESYVRETLPTFNGDAEQTAQWLTERFGKPVSAGDVSGAADVEAYAIELGRQALRMELSMLERMVMLQILDQAWQDHLYAMDRLRDSIGLKAYAEKDPRIEFKREGSRYYTEMLALVRDRVTDLIFKAQLSASPAPQRRAPDPAKQQAVHRDAAPAAAVSEQGSAQQQSNASAAERAGSGDAPRPMSRKQRRAAAARERRGKSDE